MQSPENRNALDVQMRAALADAIMCVRDDTDVHAVILTGTEGVFCAGGDLKGLMRMYESERDIFEGRARILDMHRWSDMLADLEKPVIAAIDGAAYGAGLSLALAADFILASPRASFCASFTRVGYVPDLGALYLLPRKVGITKAKQLVFGGHAIGSQEAQSIALVDHIVEEDLLQGALTYAAQFETAPKEAIGISKTILNRAFETDRSTVVEQEAMAQAMCRESRYHRNAIQDLIDRAAATDAGRS